MAHISNHLTLMEELLQRGASVLRPTHVGCGWGRPPDMEPACLTSLEGDTSAKTSAQWAAGDPGEGGDAQGGSFPPSGGSILPSYPGFFTEEQRTKGGALVPVRYSEEIAGRYGGESWPLRAGCATDRTSTVRRLFRLLKYFKGRKCLPCLVHLL